MSRDTSWSEPEVSTMAMGLRQLTTLAFLAPDIQQAIIAGQQPAGMTLAGLLASRLPLDWDTQRQVLGFAETGPDHPLQVS